MLQYFHSLRIKANVLRDFPHCDVPQMKKKTLNGSLNFQWNQYFITEVVKESKMASKYRVVCKCKKHDSTITGY